jgi:hypothetical protein
VPQKQGHQVLFVRGAGRRRADHLAVAQDGQVVRDVEELVQTVRDVDDRVPFGLLRLELVQKPHRLGLGQGGGGFVEDHDAAGIAPGAVVMQELADQCHRPLRRAEAAKAAARVYVKVDRGEHRSHPVMRRAPTEGTKPAPAHVGQKQVLGHRQVKELRGPLVQHAQAKVMGRIGVVVIAGVPPVEGHSPKLGRFLDPGRDLDQGGLAGPVDPDKPVDAPRIEAGRDIVQRDCPAIALGHAGDFKRRLCIRPGHDQAPPRRDPRLH